MDINVLNPILVKLGYEVKLFPAHKRRNIFERIIRNIKQSHRYLRHYELQIHLEQIYPEQFRFSKKNLLIPNPEFTDPDVFSKCSNLTGIICKTKSAQALLEPWHKKCLYTGFSSDDRFDNTIKKDFDKCLLLEGRSDFRGSKRLVELWNQHPEWPELTVIRNPIDNNGNLRRKHSVTGKNIKIIDNYVHEDKLQTIQNQYGTHLLLSEIEGFGHTINEALACGSVVFTTDAAPMNELIRPDYGFLIPYSRTGNLLMEKSYYFNKNSFVTTFNNYLQMSEADKIALGAAARMVFLKKQKLFEISFIKALQSI